MLGLVEDEAVEVAVVVVVEEDGLGGESGEAESVGGRAVYEFAVAGVDE
ncbi:hypothetical protein ACQ86N_29505 [Puia sp. P3]